MNPQNSDALEHSPLLFNRLFNFDDLTESDDDEQEVTGEKGFALSQSAQHAQDSLALQQLLVLYMDKLTSADLEATKRWAAVLVEQPQREKLPRLHGTEATTEGTEAVRAKGTHAKTSQPSVKPDSLVWDKALSQPLQTLQAAIHAAIPQAMMEAVESSLLNGFYRVAQQLGRLADDAKLTTAMSKNVLVNMLIDVANELALLRADVPFTAPAVDVVALQNLEHLLLECSLHLSYQAPVRIVDESSTVDNVIEEDVDANSEVDEAIGEDFDAESEADETESLTAAEVLQDVIADLLTLHDEAVVDESFENFSLDGPVLLSVYLAQQLVALDSQQRNLRDALLSDQTGVDPTSILELERGFEQQDFSLAQCEKLLPMSQTSTMQVQTRLLNNLRANQVQMKEYFYRSKLSAARAQGINLRKTLGRSLELPLTDDSPSTINGVSSISSSLAETMFNANFYQAMVYLLVYKQLVAKKGNQATVKMVTQLGETENTLPLLMQQKILLAKAAHLLQGLSEQAKLPATRALLVSHVSNEIVNHLDDWLNDITGCLEKVKAEQVKAEQVLINEQAVSESKKEMAQPSDSGVSDGCDSSPNQSGLDTSSSSNGSSAENSSEEPSRKSSPASKASSIGGSPVNSPRHTSSAGSPLPVVTVSATSSLTEESPTVDKTTYSSFESSFQGDFGGGGGGLGLRGWDKRPDPSTWSDSEDEEDSNQEEDLSSLEEDWRNDSDNEREAEENGAMPSSTLGNTIPKERPVSALRMGQDELSTLEKIQSESSLDRRASV